jgi:hypothetical protein
MSKELKERFTPGPWITDGKFVGNTLEDYVAMVVGDSKEERIANAALIASAPEMYETLTRIVGKAKRDGTIIDTGGIDYLKQVLKKARGEA